MAAPFLALQSYLQEVRSLARKRAGLHAIGAWLSAALWIAVAGTLYTAWSGRGDLARLLVAGGMGLAAWVCASERWSAFGRRAPTLDACAHAIAGQPEPEKPALAQLRQDIAAAHSLKPAPESQLSSSALRDLYLTRVGQALPQLPVPEALPGKPWDAVVLSLGLGAVAASLCLALLGPSALALMQGQDVRAPRSASMFWESIGVELVFPEHTQRDAQRLEPVAGQLRLPKGTTLSVWVDLPAKNRFSALKVRDLAGDFELALQPDPRTDSRYTGQWQIEGPLSLELVGVDRESSTTRPKHAPAFGVSALLDKPAQIELKAANQRKRGDRDSTLPIRIEARDDYGLRSLSLFYQSPDNEAASVQIPLQGQPKEYKDTFQWDLSTIPVEQRSDLVYWIEARDNDPSLDPRDQKPGKVSQSTRRTLILDDARAQHQAFLRQLAATRDESVDLLGKTMLPRLAKGQVRGLQPRLEFARSLHDKSAQFLTNLARLVELLSRDAYAARSTLRVLSEVHKRSRQQYELVAPLLRFIYSNQPKPQKRLFDPWSEDAAARQSLGLRMSNDRLRAALNEWMRMLPETQAQLEDDVIRLDDLVDAELIEQLQSLLGALRASQKKLVKWLDALDPKDPNARARIEQLEARIQLDMRRIQELRALLSEEVDPGFYNKDALDELAARMKHQSVKERLAKGDLDGARKSAQSSLSQLDSVDQELEDKDKNPPHLTPKEKAQRYLRKALSQIKDKQADLLEQTPQSLQTAQNEPSDEWAQGLEQAMRKVQDTELSQPGRRALERAKDAVEDLRNPKLSPLQHQKARETLRHTLQKAQQGAPRKQAQALSTLYSQAHERANQAPAQSLPKDPERQQTQKAIAAKLHQLSQAPEAQAAMEPLLRDLLEQAESSMQDSAQAIEQGRSFRSTLSQKSAQKELDQALETLSQSPPPPPPERADPASTQAKQDTSLRQAVLKALKEGSESLTPETRAYYESLLDP